MGGKEVPFDPTLVDLRPNCAAAQFARNDEGEGEEAGGADGCAAGFDGGCIAAARSAVEVGAALFFFFVGGDQRGGGGENCREGEEEAADSGTEFFGHEAGGDGDEAAEEEADGVFVGLRFFGGGEVYFYAHDFIFAASGRVPSAAEAAKLWRAVAAGLKPCPDERRREMLRCFWMTGKSGEAEKTETAVEAGPSLRSLPSSGLAG
jgi:hypothetical protein